MNKKEIEQWASAYMEFQLEWIKGDRQARPSMVRGLSIGAIEEKWKSGLEEPSQMDYRHPWWWAISDFVIDNKPPEDCWRVIIEALRRKPPKDIFGVLAVAHWRI